MHHTPVRCARIEIIQLKGGKFMNNFEPYPIGSMYAIYGNMDPINISPMLAYIPAPWILWVPRRKGFHFPRRGCCASKSIFCFFCHRRCRRVAVLGPQFRFSEVVQKQWLPMKWPLNLMTHRGSLQCFRYLVFGLWLLKIGWTRSCASSKS